MLSNTTQQTRSIHVGMLNADTSVPNVYGALGTFGDILQRVLAASAFRTCAGLSIKHSVFDVVRGEYPESLRDFDAVVITASAASSYDDQHWIRALKKYIVTLYKKHPRIKIFGSCFGHHLICEALLKDHGLRVEKNPQGWEIGISEVIFSNEFIRTFGGFNPKGNQDNHSRFSGRLPSPEDDGSRGDNDNAGFLKRARLQFVHEDQVVLPSLATTLARPWVLIGSTEHCAVQGIYQIGRVLTLQGHFEFDKFDTRHTMHIFGAELDNDEAYDPGLNRSEDDGEVVASMVVRFLAEQGPICVAEDKCDSAAMDLPTPRTSVELHSGFSI